MIHLPSPRSRRLRGATVVILAVMLPVVIGGLALSVDTAVLATARAQLSTVADAAALAGARRLATDMRAGGIRSVILDWDVARAKEEAIKAGERNDVLGDPADLTPWDVQVGYLDIPTPKGEVFADRDAMFAKYFSTSSTHRNYYNTVRVTARRDSSHTGVVPSFFSKLWNNGGSSMSVNSAATVMGLVGFKSFDGSTTVNLLPIVLDKATYETMIAQNPIALIRTDQYTHTPGLGNGKVTKGPDGIYESMLYPVSAGLPGNWGTVNIGVKSNSTSVLGDQIRNGITSGQLNTFAEGKIQLNQKLSPPSITFSGDPGISAGIKDDLTHIIGKAVYIPIYDIASGNGNNAAYRVVSFAPVRVLHVDFKGGAKYVIVQPATIEDDGTQVWGGVTSWPLGGEFRLSLTR